jgi:lipoate-protein ligase A
MQILVKEHLSHPEDGFGLQQAVLEGVAANERGPTALLWTSSAYIGATRPETRLTGFDEAVDLAEGAGFPVLVRNSGGGAVAANEGSISFSLTFPVEDVRHGLYERYSEGVDLVVSALRKLGVPAQAGEVEGEFCPGAYSVRIDGYYGTKIAGLAQRVTRRAARVEALILVSKTGELKRILKLFYSSLGLPFRSESVSDLPGTDVPQAIKALVEAVQERYHEPLETKVDERILQRAIDLRESWRATPGFSGSISGHP